VLIPLKWEYITVCCSALQCVAVCCSVLQCGNSNDTYESVTYITVCCSVLQCAAVCCSVLQCVAVCCVKCCSVGIRMRQRHTSLQYTAKQRKILHHTATHCHTLQHTAKQRNILHHTATQCKTAAALLLYGVATLSRLLKIIGLFCKRDL